VNEEHEKFRQKLLNEPTEVEKHFVEAEKKLKQIETRRKQDSSSRQDRKNQK
jgi:hypothetical protein